MVESRKDRNWDEKLKRVEAALKNIGSSKLRPAKSQKEGARGYVPSINLETKIRIENIKRAYEATRKRSTHLG